MARIISDTITLKISKIVRDDSEDADVLGDADFEVIQEIIETADAKLAGAVVELDLGED